ncbi:alpha-L-arabinofuranosidase C-terminal domain-containing protein [Pedobacter antarcticus]|uniref:non-reducing end alpha-L-arabinofuranosidase n=2 Tax=Pedobacter antarcticus TaxID=34086 RepID=A0A081PL91_9SPHI|nr:alpha-L-arabinofuranosidase C-terminal domain-containing protein [Pedobacter antarcticus]KEQ31464.1 alpha-L-arabinofuranosidase [Pedobacter antarcticus 4BY]SDM71520.1 Alpha-L-arabinofuranosidase [Pedobacter antarcticus]SFE74884.1 Alpha-L-arabinofuranosidase [Pedobacter antarcticus]
MKFKPFALAAITALCTLQVQAQKTRTIVVDPAKQTAKVQPEMWGVFFEDINMGADGGIYAELIKNRSFEFYKPMMGWKVEGKRIEGDVLVLNRQESKSSNPRYIRVKTGGKQTDLALYNEGFKGIGVKKGLEYDFSVMYRQQQKGLKLHIALVDSTGKVLGQSELIPEKPDGQWQSQHASFKSAETVEKANFKIWFEGEGAIDLDMISLFPGDTWKNRKGGLRGDMVQLLADMKPGFVRFPGGCIVEGHDLSTRYQWKKTIGPVADREVIINRWNTEFAHRPSPDYYQTFGLGFYEYFQLAEDIGATALPILNCGMACQFNTAELVPLDELGPYIQDALDLVEFANGAVSTPWGKVRADMGHPEPFNLKMLGVGNENWGPQYLERLELFTKALKSKYPDILLVNSSGTDPDGERFDLLNTSLRKMKADIIDEHYYRSPDWFLKNANRYDSYDRKGSKVFAGEYAAQSKAIANPGNQNNWECAIAEAAFLTGLERNADVVHMASYAPLFAHAEGWQWTPDMIWVDNLNVYGTPNYYVQKLYSLYKGTDVVSILEDNKFISGQQGIYASAVTDSETGELIIKIINPGKETLSREIQIKGSKKAAATAQLILLQNNNPGAVNTFSNAVNVSPETSPLSVKNNKVNLELKPYSFNLIRVDLKGKGVL